MSEDPKRIELPPEVAPERHERLRLHGWRGRGGRIVERDQTAGKLMRPDWIAAAEPKPAKPAKPFKPYVWHDPARYKPSEHEDSPEDHL